MTSILPYRIAFILYMVCPRGAGDAEDHKNKFLVHHFFRGRCVCMTAEMAKDLVDADS